MEYYTKLKQLTAIYESDMMMHKAIFVASMQHAIKNKNPKKQNRFLFNE